MRKLLRTIAGFAVLLGIQHNCQAQYEPLGVFTGNIGNSRTVQIQLFNDGAKHLAGFELEGRSQRLLLIDGRSLPDGTWTLEEREAPGHVLRTISCTIKDDQVNGVSTSLDDGTGTSVSLRRKDDSSDLSPLVKAQSEQYAQQAFEAAMAKRYEDARFFLRLYRVTSLDNPYTNSWETLFEAGRNHQEAALYSSLLGCEGWECGLKREVQGYLEEEGGAIEAAKNSYRKYCYDQPNTVLPPAFTCLMYAAFGEKSGDQQAIWEGYDAACLQLHFACGRSFGEAEVRLVDDIKHHRDAVVERDLSNSRLNINAMNGRALYTAVTNDSLVVVKLLLEKGADPNRGGGTILYAALDKRLGIMAQTLLDSGADPNLHGGTSCLEVAAAHDDVAAVKLLLARGADINHDDAVGAGTALILAVENRNAALVKLLLDHGADPTLTAKFHHAPTSSKDPRIRRLIDAAILECKSRRRQCSAAGD